ncbi:HNH endonuclease, partial [Mycobacterium tuberculosis]
AKERGGARPGGDAPADHREGHHGTPGTTTHRTDSNDRTRAGGPDKRRGEKGGKTRKNAKGDTEGRPPAHGDQGQPRSKRDHHP